MQFGVGSMTLDLGMLSYVTTWNVVVVLAWAVAASIVTGQDLVRHGVVGWSTPWARGAGFVLVLCAVTMSMFFLVVAPTLDASSRLSPTSVATHVVVPVALIGEWLIFGPKGAQRPLDPLMWLVPFVAYIAWVYVSHALGGRFRGDEYPYAFLSLESGGWMTVVTTLMIMGGAIIALGVALRLLDSALGRSAAD